MSEVQRKQLDKSTEINIDYISAIPQWYKFVVDYTDIEAAAVENTITLCRLPVKSWVHAVHWKVTTSFSQDGTWAPTVDDKSVALQVSLGDEDSASRWLNAAQILFKASGGGETPTDIEDGIGIILWEPDFSNTHDLEAYFNMTNPGSSTLNGLDAGEITFWFLLSSMNL